MRNLSVSRLSLGAALLAFAVVGCADDSLVNPDTRELPDRPDFSHTANSGPGPHVLVASAEAAPSTGLLAAIEAAGGTVMHQHDEIGVVHVQGLTDAAASALAGRADVEGVDRDFQVRWIPTFEELGLHAEESNATAADPGSETDQSSAPFYAAGWQWNISQIEADDAWLTTNQGAGASVAVLDTGVDPFQIDLASSIDPVNSTSVLSPGSSPCGPFDEATIFDLNFHGTFVSALVSSNGVGMASVAPDASLIGVKVLACNGFGFWGDIMDGIMHAANVGADVINMSLGAIVDKKAAKELIKALERAVKYAKKQGSLVIASAGNEGLNLDDNKDLRHIPSQIKHVLSVGATAPYNQMNFDDLAPYTNYGKKGVDVMAPGGGPSPGGFPFLDGILSACSSFICPGTNWYLLGGQGTSFAAPHAAGAAAVYESEKAKNEKGEKLGKCVEKGSEDLGKKGRDEMYGKGRINVLAAAACKDPKKL